MSKLWIVLLIFLVGCSSLSSTRNITPVAEPDITILPITKAVATTRNGISIVVVYLRDVKALDGFGVMIVNETPNWISIKKDECMLIQEGKVIYPLNDSQVSSRLGATYKPQMPDELNADIYGWRSDVNTRSSRGSKIMDENKKLSIITGARETIFLFFKTQGSTAPMQLIIPNIYNEATKQRTKFSFKFNVEK